MVGIKGSKVTLRFDDGSIGSTSVRAAQRIFNRLVIRQASTVFGVSEKEVRDTAAAVGISGRGKATFQELEKALREKKQARQIKEREARAAART